MHLEGKEHKRYEFGCKVRVATTSRHGWVVGIDAEHGNPYDGHTLKRTTEQIERLSGVRPEQAFVDRGYPGQRAPSERNRGVHIWEEGVDPDFEGSVEKEIGDRAGDRTPEGRSRPAKEPPDGQGRRSNERNVERERIQLEKALASLPFVLIRWLLSPGAYAQ